MTIAKSYIPDLSVGAFNKLLEGDSPQNIILQILGFKKVLSTRSDLYRLLLNDGDTEFSNAVLSRSLNHLIENKKFEKYTVFKLNNYKCNQLAAHTTIVICLDVEILIPGFHVKEKISTKNRMVPCTSNKQGTQALLEVSNIIGHCTSNEILCGASAKTASNHVVVSEMSCDTSKSSTLNPSVVSDMSCGTSMSVISNHAVVSEMSCDTSKSSTLNPSAVTDMSCGTSMSLTSNYFSVVSEMSCSTSKSKTSNDTVLSKMSCDSSNHVFDNEMSCDNSISTTSNHVVSEMSYGTSMSSTSNHEIVSEMSCGTSCNTASNHRDIGEMPFNTLRHTTSNHAVVNKRPCDISTSTSCNIKTSNCHRFRINPIQSISPYQMGWIIKARITKKSDVINYSSGKGEGRFFSFYLLDESGEIKVLAFNDCSDMFYDAVQENCTYYISNADVRSGRYEHGRSEYELFCKRDTRIELCHDDVSDIPFMKFSFVPICKINSNHENSFIDVIGVCHSVSDLQVFTKRSDNREVVKRELLLVDKGASIIVTLWGNEAKNFGISGIGVIALKRAKLVSFNKLTLVVSSSTILYINPDMQEARQLRAWYKTLDQYKFNSISCISNSMGLLNWKIFSQISSISLLDNKTYYFVTKAAIVLLHKENCLYKACPSVDCYKKVYELPNGLYKCDKCNREVNNFQYVLFLRVDLADFSSDHHVIAFRDTAEAILGITVEELCEIKKKSEDDYYDLLSNVNFKSLIFKLRSKVETFNEKCQLKTTVVSSSPLDYVAYGKKLLSDIKHMESLLK